MATEEIPSAEAPAPAPPAPEPRAFTLADLEALPKPPRTQVRLPVSGLVIHLEGFTMARRDAWDSAGWKRADRAAEVAQAQGRPVDKYSGTAGYRARLLAWCAINPDGTPLFAREADGLTTREAEVAKLQGLDFRDLEAAVAACEEFAGLAKHKGTTLGKSEGTEGSPSDSPSA